MSRMSDQQAKEILARLGGLEQSNVGLSQTVGGLVHSVRALEDKVEVLTNDVEVLKVDVAVLKTDVAELKTDVKDLRRHMGVLHEDVLDRIKGIREDDSLRQEMRAGFAEMRQLFAAHTVPGDAADRHFAATLADHGRRIHALEADRSR